MSPTKRHSRWWDVKRSNKALYTKPRPLAELRTRVPLPQVASEPNRVRHCCTTRFLVFHPGGVSLPIESQFYASRSTQKMRCYTRTGSPEKSGVLEMGNG